MQTDQITLNQIINKVEELKKMIVNFIGDDTHILDVIDSPELAEYDELCNAIIRAAGEFEQIREEEEENNIGGILMKNIKGETSFQDNQNEVITTFVPIDNNKDKVIVTFDTTDKLNLKMNNVVIIENGNIKEYNKDILNLIPEEWNDVLNSMESLTIWFKLDTKEQEV